MKKIETIQIDKTQTLQVLSTKYTQKYYFKIELQENICLYLIDFFFF